MALQLAPIPRRGRRPLPGPQSADYLFAENVFSSIIAGSGLMASLSTAACLQHFFPSARFAEFPAAGLAGLLLGWYMAVPVTRWFARRLDPYRPARVLLTALVAGVAWAVPGAVYASEIGWSGGAFRILIVAAVLSASGLVWGGYFDCDKWAES